MIADAVHEPSATSGTGTAVVRLPHAVEPHVRLQDVSMTFGDHRALDAVSLDIPAGQVLGLVGENGSGKSTLIKILNGMYRPDRGSRIFVRGEEIFPYEDSTAFRRLGISFVHQDLGLIPSVSVTENLLRERILHSTGAFIPWRAMHAEAGALLEKFGIEADPRRPISELSDTDRALVAILRAVEELGPNRTLLVLDEPTVFLPRTGTELLFRVVRHLLAEYDMSVLLVSHDLEEVLANCESVVVLKSGVVQCAVRSRQATPAMLGERIVGRRVSGERSSRSAGGVVVAMSVTGLESGRAVGVSFDLHRGEILGITGLAGAGFEDVLPAVFGAQPATGTVTLADGRPVGETPRQALSRGLVYVPADRKTEGGIMDVSIQENALLPRLRSVSGAMGLSGRKMAAAGRDFSQRYDVRPAAPGKAFRLLSGGNQQKVVLGKWLDTRPEIVLLQDPTQGIDVGAREAINARLLEAADQGTAVLCATTDYEQLALLCDRVLIIDAGSVVDELSGPDLHRATIALRVLNAGTDDLQNRKAG